MDDDLRTLLSHSPAGPPLDLTAADVVTQGARIRRRRKLWAVAGSSLATAAVLVLAGLTVGHRGPAPLEPARPGLSTVAPPTGSSPMPTTAIPTMPPQVPTQAPSDPPPRADRTGAPGAPGRSNPTARSNPPNPSEPSEPSTSSARRPPGQPASATRLPSAPPSATATTR